MLLCSFGHALLPGEGEAMAVFPVVERYLSNISVERSSNIRGDSDF